ncbi:potassium transporter KtrA [Bifidobacterium sp. DSM 109958]|uniref:Potassium-transporting ATPase KdpC subunit n=3 Tax=Bifidobacterium TaxID=1678 RepID=A0A7Y0HWQ8_9BIFI|nr:MULTISPECIES: K(+)-transporting ATPase subunit C [Bifidobacterium]MBT1163324.1 K(+)-transporting ATPase subunit C [Bifidobacterium felsineum]MBT1181639.1 K(+)-transporting ATPase subunit C [Bifidobacterium sp. CP2]MBW3093193.1 K(+)-transporting ATPase subunit C [Bifidobacterium miconis]NMM97174.1 potassium transporter KtrA [Bifidobacterium sp. DSM 109959]NMN00739.1 potassium transporter KtrA [Bifidobacterium sp. DSM 109958]
MKNTISLNLRAYWAGLKAVIVFTVIVIVYTFVMTGIGQLGMPDKANGSMITNAQGEVVGSSLIGQSFTDANGDALPQYFQSRPSAASDPNKDEDSQGYYAAASAGTNKGHADADFVKSTTELRKTIAKREGVSVKDVPSDAVTASSSGLDPEISPEYAAIQVKRVAKERGLSEEQVENLVRKYTTGRGLGFIGESTVNVVRLNLALDELK